MDFKQIEAFVNVVRYKSFSKAADATFFTQPTISTHIRNLEKELGVKLLDRKSRVVEMTPQGSKFYKYAVEMINARAQAFDALNDNSENVGGILEIQTSSIPAVTFLPDLLSGFRTPHPRIQYSRIKLAVAFQYLFIWRETGSATRRTFEQTALRSGFEKEEFEVAALVDDMDTMIRSVEAGLGVAIISEKVASSIGGRVKVADIEDFNEDRVFYMINLKSTSYSPAAEAFISYVKTVMNEK